MPSLALGGGHKDLKTPAAATELRQRARAALLGLEDRDTAEQAAWGAQRLIAELHAPWVAEELLKELLAGLDACCAAARRARYRLAAFLVRQRGMVAVAGLVPLLVRRLIEQAGAEKAGAALDDLAGFMRELARTALDHEGARPAAAIAQAPEQHQQQHDCLGRAIIRPLLRAAAKSPCKQAASNCYALVHAALLAFFERAQSPSVAAAAADALKLTLAGMASGQPGAHVPEAYLALRGCIEILGSGLKPPTVRAALLEALNGMRCKSDFRTRKEATDALAALAASIQARHPRTFQGHHPVFRQAGEEWRLEASDGLAVLASHRPLIMAALADVKYDKIVHVRQAALKALTEMDCIPEPTSTDRQRAQAALSSAAPSPPPSPAASAQPPRSRRASEPGSGTGAPRSAAAAGRRPMQRHARENAAAAATGKQVEGQDKGVRSELREPEQQLQECGRGGSWEDDVRGRKPRLHTQGVGAFDFGVQVYAPRQPPPPPAAAEQTESTSEPAVPTPVGQQPAARQEEQLGPPVSSAPAAAADNSTGAAATVRTPLIPSAAATAAAGEQPQVDVAVLLQQLRHFQQMAAAVSAAAPEQHALDGIPSIVALHEQEPDTPAASTVLASHPIEVQQQCSPSPARYGAEPDQAEPATPLHAQPIQESQQPPWEATPGAKALVASQRELLAHLQQVLEDPASLAMPPAQLAELQGSLLRATAALAQSRALHSMRGLLDAPDQAPAGSRPRGAVHTPSSRAGGGARHRLSMTAPDGPAAEEGTPLFCGFQSLSSRAGSAAGTGLRTRLEAAMGSSSRRLSDALQTSPSSAQGEAAHAPPKPVPSSALAEPTGLLGQSQAAASGSPALRRAKVDLGVLLQRKSGDKAAAGGGEGAAAEGRHDGGSLIRLRGQDRQSLLRGITREVDRLLGSTCRGVGSEEDDEELSAGDDDGELVTPASTAGLGGSGSGSAIGRGSLKSLGGSFRAASQRHGSGEKEAASPIDSGKLATVHCNPLYSKQEQQEAAEREGTKREVVVASAASGKRPGVPGSSECIDAIAEQIAAKLLTKLEARYRA